MLIIASGNSSCKLSSLHRRCVVLNCIDVGLDCDVLCARITYNMQDNVLLNVYTFLSPEQVCDRYYFYARPSAALFDKELK